MSILNINGHLVLDPQDFTTSTGDNNDVAVYSSIVRITPNTNGDAITGIASSASRDGELLFLSNVGTTNNLVIRHNNGSSSAMNRLLNNSSGDLTLPPKMVSTYKYIEGIGWAEFNFYSSINISAELKRTTNQSIPNNSLTAIQWTSEVKKSGISHDNVTNNSRLTILAGGDYEGGTTIWFTSWDAITTARFEVQLFKNGVFYKELYDTQVLSSNAPTISCSFMAPNCAAGDYFDIRVLQNTGVSRDASSDSYFWMIKI